MMQRGSLNPLSLVLVLLAPMTACLGGLGPTGGAGNPGSECAAGEHRELDVCVPNERACEMPDGPGTQTWTGAWGDCEVRACEVGYQLVDNVCEPDACTDSLDWVSIPVRFHLLRSEIEGLNASLSETELLQLIEDAQTYLNQACIHIGVESIIEDPVGSAREEAYNEAWSNPAAVPPEALKPIMTAAMPTGNLLSPGWNVMVFKNFNKYTSGVYLSEIPSVLFAEQIPPMGGGAPNPPVILAHELGHALGLLHYEGPNLESNLMCESVYQNRDRADELTPAQIEIAHAQASTGNTYLPTNSARSGTSNIETSVGEILDAQVPPLVDPTGSPGKAIGLVVGVSYNGTQVIRGYGATARYGDVTPASDAVFEIGSITKVVTGYLLARGLANGELQPINPISMYFETDVPAYGATPIRLIHLATHRSGLPNYPDNLVGVGTGTPGAGYTRTLLEQFLAGYTLTRAPGSEYLYSNLGSGILGQACVDAAGVNDFETLVWREIGTPLGLADFHVELTPGQAARKLQGHSMGMPAPQMELGAPLQGGGALQTTATDLLKFLEAGLDGDDPAWELVKTPRAELPVTPNAQIGFQIAIESQPDGPTIYSKNGQTPGFSSQFVFATEPPVAVVLLSNAANTQGLLSLGKAIIAASEDIEVE